MDVILKLHQNYINYFSIKSISYISATNNKDIKLRNSCQDTQNNKDEKDKLKATQMLINETKNRSGKQISMHVDKLNQKYQNKKPEDKDDNIIEVFQNNRKVEEDKIKETQLLIIRRKKKIALKSRYLSMLIR